MELLHQYGYSLVFLIVLFEQLGLPVPALPMLMIAGALSASGELKLGIVFLLAAAAALIGDFVWFLFGRRYGRRILKLLCRISLSPEDCVRKTEVDFGKHGLNSLMYAKFVPGLNTIAPPMAGAVGATISQFVWRDLAGIALYLTACIWPGFFFEKRIFDIVSWFEQIGEVLFFILAGGLGTYILLKFVRLKIIQRTLFHARIDAKQLHERIQAGERMIIVDLRASKNDGEASLPGAIRIPPGQIDQNLHLLNKDLPIIMYCT